MQWGVLLLAAAAARLAQFLHGKEHYQQKQSTVTVLSALIRCIPAAY
jgi:hypothetical protein